MYKLNLYNKFVNYLIYDYYKKKVIKKMLHNLKSYKN